MKFNVKKLLALVLSFVMVMSLLTACGSSSSSTDEAEETVEEAEEEAEEAEEVEEVEEAEDTASETRTVTDAEGNVVEVPADLSKIAVIPMPYASIVYAIDGSSERIVTMNPSSLAAYTGHFLEKLDSNYATIDTTAIGTDFSINIEELVNMGVEAAVIWADENADDAEKLEAVGITPIMVRNESIDVIHDSIIAIGQLLGKEERAESFTEFYEETYEYLNSYADEVEAAEKTTVLYLTNDQLGVTGSSTFIGTGAMDLAGAENVGAGLSSITMEEVIAADPDIILLSNFDDIVPDDLYNNTIDGQDWSTVSAVVNHRVYKVPMGIYRWDAPGVETPLMMMWLAQLMQPEIFDEIDIVQETKDFMEEYFDYTLTDEDVAQIFAEEANANSQ